MTRRSDPPVVLVKWYDFTKWVLGHVDNFPKNQRFVFGQRLADGVLGILELIVDATYSDKKSKILLEVNRRFEVLRWLLRLAFDRRLLAGKQAPGLKCRKTGWRRSIWHGHFMCCANHTFSGTTQDSCASDRYLMGE